jgi:hypothetical protein
MVHNAVFRSFFVLLLVVCFLLLLAKESHVITLGSDTGSYFRFDDLMELKGIETGPLKMRRERRADVIQAISNLCVQCFPRSRIRRERRIDQQSLRHWRTAPPAASSLLTYSTYRPYVLVCSSSSHRSNERGVVDKVQLQPSKVVTLVVCVLTIILIKNQQKTFKKFIF